MSERTKSGSCSSDCRQLKEQYMINSKLRREVFRTDKENGDLRQQIQRMQSEMRELMKQSEYLTHEEIASGIMFILRPEKDVQ